MLVRLGQGPGKSRVALGTLLGKVTFVENIRIKSRELGYVSPISDMTFVVDWRTSSMVKGIRGQSYATMGIWPLCPWDPVTLLRYPSYPTFTSKVILELTEVICLTFLLLLDVQGRKHTCVKRPAA